MPDKRSMLTNATGPVVCGERTLRALLAIRKEKLLPALYEQPIVMVRSNVDAMADVLSDVPPWLTVMADAPDQPLPERCLSATPSEAATLRVALSLPASLVLLEEPTKERAKLSFIKVEGTVSILVSAYRTGQLSAVRPMVKALKALGHEDILPEQHMLDALWKALDELE